MLKKGVLKKKMIQEGYGDIAEFIRRSKVGLSHEACRRAIYEDKPITTISLLRLMVALNFTREEIRDAIADTDRVIADLIGPQAEEPLKTWERAWLAIGRAIYDKDVNVFRTLISSIQVYVRSLGLEPVLQDEISKLI